MRSGSNIQLIFDSADSLNQPIHVQGGTATANAFIVARHVQRLSGDPKRIVVICPNHDIATDFASDLESLCSLNPGSSPVDIRLFPSWDQSPFSPIAPSIRTRLTRLATLQALSTEKPEQHQVLITTVAASCQATIPRNIFKRLLIHLRPGEMIESRESLIAKLMQSGYARVDTVEDPGTFAVRGELIDVYSPGFAWPLRVELFGDEIERIRFFDPTSQRTLSKDTEPLKGVSLVPAREVLINSESISGLRERVKQRADDLGISRSARDPVLTTLQNGGYPDHSDAWPPFAYPSPDTLWDYVFSTDSPQVIFLDELSGIQNWDSFFQDQLRLASEATQSSLILPEPASLFRWDSDLERRVRDKVLLYLDQLQLVSLETIDSQRNDSTGPAGAAESQTQEAAPATHHRVSVRANSDLSESGSRPSHSLEELDQKIRLWLKQGFKIVAFASTQSQLDRIRYLLSERGHTTVTEVEPQPSRITLVIGTLSEGMRWPAEGWVILTEQDLIGTRTARTKRERGPASKAWSGLQALSDLSIGDAVVHTEHGIGRYQGLVRLDLSGAPSDFLLLEYANRDRLYLPIYRLNVIQKYVGASEGLALDRLGNQQFAKTKDKVKEAIKKLAIDLVNLYAERKVRSGIRMSPPDAFFREFETKFPFDETPDQIKAIEDILKDLQSGRSMDRLVCGDVGYGKTEVAIRAAFRAISDGKQVAVLVPTTVLAFQHEQSFKARMADYPIRIESVSRFKSSAQQKAIIEALANGKVDLIIGTHRLLSQDVRFQDLGLVIVDEEHRFGVEHKERLKTLKVNTHFLTLTATPIPRTLHMALSGLRDISLINTPPVDRLPIRTYVSRYDDALIQRAIRFELGRGGLVFFLHNRVQDIREVAAKIKELVPEGQVAIAHGQMGERELEKIMLSFYERKTQILVCTTIIESGLDVPSANTIIINRADALGLAQLYQIRGRVGRGQNRAYAYLLIPTEGSVSGDAKRRLEVIQKFVELGSGFSIASHDLEIRGGGDLLGPQQSGNINAVGFDLYMELLEEAIRELEGQPGTPEQASPEPEIKAPFPAFLGEGYVPDIHHRLSLYRRFSAATQDDEITSLEEELRDRFGSLPNEASNLVWLIRLKQLLKHNGIESLTVGSEKIAMMIGSASALRPARAIALVSSHPGEYHLMPDSKFVAKIPTASFQELLFAMERLIDRLQ